MTSALNRLNDTLGTSPSLTGLSDAIEAMCELSITELSTQMEDYYPEYDSWRCFQSKIIHKIETMLPNLGVYGSINNEIVETWNGVEATWLVGALIEKMYRSAAIEEHKSG